MRIDTPKDLRVREVRVINVSGEEIPANSFAKITDVDLLGYLEIDKPDANSISSSFLVVTGGTKIPIGGRGTAFPADSNKLYVALELAGAVPANGDNFGTKSGEWWGEKGQSGFKALGAIGGSACINPFKQERIIVKRYFRARSLDGVNGLTEELTEFENIWINKAADDSITRVNFLFTFTDNDVTVPVTSETSFLFVIPGSFDPSFGSIASALAVSASVTWQVKAITEQIDVSGGLKTYSEINSLAGQVIESFGLTTTLAANSSQTTCNTQDKKGAAFQNGNYTGASPIHAIAIQLSTDTFNALDDSLSVTNEIHGGGSALEIPFLIAI